MNRETPEAMLDIGMSAAAQADCTRIFRPWPSCRLGTAVAMSSAAPPAAILHGRGGSQHGNLALQGGRQADVRRARLHGQRAQVLWQPQGLQELRLLRGFMRRSSAQTHTQWQGLAPEAPAEAGLVRVRMGELANATTPYAALTTAAAVFCRHAVASCTDVL